MAPADGNERTGNRGAVLFTDGIGVGGVGRSADWRAILPGAAVVAVVAAGAYLSSLPAPLAALGVPLGGAVTGWLSRTFESEGYDGAMAALVGTMVAFVVALAVVWVRTTALVSTKLLVAASGFALTVVFTALAMLVSGAVAHVTAGLRRRLRFVSDPVGLREEGRGGRR